MGSEARTNVTLGPKEAVVLERLPLSFAPEAKTPAHRWTAGVSQVHYGAEGVTLRVSAPKGGVLTLSAGAFPLPDGAVVKVRLGQAARSVKVANHALHLAVPVGFADGVSIGR